MAARPKSRLRPRVRSGPDYLTLILQLLVDRGFQAAAQSATLQVL